MTDPSTAESPRIADLRRRLQQAPSVRLLVELAREYHETGLFEEASRIAARAVREQPSYVSARVQLGRIYFDMGRVEEAREQMEAVLSIAPDNLVARRVVADVCREMGDVQGALDRYRALLAFSPSDEETRRKIAEVEKEAAAAPAAVQESPPAAEGGSHGHEAALEPGVLATPTLAELYLTQGLPAKAASVYREILRGDPGNAEAVARLTEIEGPPPASDDPAARLRVRKSQILERWLAALRR
ncbi:MAG: tetratricopeptide repeat protein [Candidatus Polarisedimenticolia bacterium]